MSEVFGGVGGFSCGGGFGTSTAAILVLFILLVIISMAFIF
ncbi:YjcZ family sporulation protein [Paenibacillus motobuensis]|uniref:Sporulation protein YjcZ n=1 Tax=Paenibacillus motobuensis TaxID=295324 RepID=A0ABN0YPT0_9BACL